jgi:hypothetical protein
VVGDDDGHGRGLGISKDREEVRRWRLGGDDSDRDEGVMVGVVAPAGEGVWPLVVDKGVV